MRDGSWKWKKNTKIASNSQVRAPVVTVRCCLNLYRVHAKNKTLQSSLSSLKHQNRQSGFLKSQLLARRVRLSSLRWTMNKLSVTGLESGPKWTSDAALVLRCRSTAQVSHELGPPNTKPNRLLSGSLWSCSTSRNQLHHRIERCSWRFKASMYKLWLRRIAFMML